MFKAYAGYRFGQRFHQIKLGVLDHCHDPLLDIAIIHGVLEPIALSCLAEVRRDRHVDHYILLVAPLFVIHADYATHEKITDQDAVHCRPPEGAGLHQQR
jgi:hypothetical protein